MKLILLLVVSLTVLFGCGEATPPELSQKSNSPQDGPEEALNHLDQMFRESKASDVFNMPETPSDFVGALCQRQFWSNIDPQIIHSIARNADGEMELLRNFVFVSEHYGLVSGNFVDLAKDPPFDSPLEGFALTLYNLGSSLCKQSLSIDDLDQQRFALFCADMAFTSSILCDRFQLGGYAGMAFLYGEFMPNKPVALEWCQKYRDAEDSLLATPDEELTLMQKSAKLMIKDSVERQRVMRLAAKHMPDLIDADHASEDTSMRDIIDVLDKGLREMQ